MITYEDVQAFDLSITHRFERAQVETFVAYANAAFPDNTRFAGKNATAQRGRILYVMHMLEKPSVDLNAPWIRRQMNAANPKPHGRKAHPWDATSHGKALKTLTLDSTRSAPKGAAPASPPRSR